MGPQILYDTLFTTTNMVATTNSDVTSDKFNVMEI